MESASKLPGDLASPLRARPEAPATPVPETPMTFLVAGRYHVRQSLGPHALLADDERLGIPVILRRPGWRGRFAPWRRRAKLFAGLRHPNLLNVFEVTADGREPFVVTECPSGPSLAELLVAGVKFSLEDAVRTLPLTTLDFVAARLDARHGLSPASVFVELREAGHSFQELAAQPVWQWPTFVVKVDPWYLIRPACRVRQKPPNGRLSTRIAVRYTALLAHDLLNGPGPERGGGSWRPVAHLTPSANALLHATLRGRRRFAASEEFLWALEEANGTGPAIQPVGAESPPVPPEVGRRLRATRAPAFPRFKVAALAAAAVVAVVVVAGAVVGGHTRGGYPALFGRGRAGEVRLRTDPADAEISVDGAAPVSLAKFDGRLKEGTHRLTLSRAGHQPKELAFQLEPGQRLEFGTVTLAPAVGTLAVTGDLPQIPFEVTGPHAERFTGVTPARLENLSPGRYTVRLRPPNFPEYVEGADVVAGDVAAADHTFGARNDDAAYALAPFPTARPSPAVSSGTDDADDESDVEEGPGTPAAKAKANETKPRARESARAALPKAEAFRQFDDEWDAKERSLRNEISLVDRQMASASGSRRERLKAQRLNLEKRRDYVRELRRYRRTELRRKYGEPDTLWDSIRNTFTR